MYVGVMNDAYFVVTEPPSPCGTDCPPDTPHPNQRVVCKVEGDLSPEKNRFYANLFASAPKMSEALCALRSLRGCLPDKIYIYGAYGEKWSDTEPDAEEFEIINLKALLGD